MQLKDLEFPPHEPITTDAIEIPTSFRFDTDYEYNEQTQQWDCWAVYYTPTADVTSIRRSVGSEDEAILLCKWMIKEVWKRCVR